MKNALKLFLLFLTISSLSACAQLSSVGEPVGVSKNDHEALAKYYEGLVSEAKVRLQENKEILKEYEEHPYYFGRQGMEVKSHASANIREYEKALLESQINADIHRRIALEMKANIENKAKANQDRDFTSKNPQSPVKKNL